MYKHFFKQIFDFIITLISLICISPLLIVITVLLYFTNNGMGVFFLQERPGKGGKIFKVIKFKTMTDERDKNGNLLPNERRITKTGKIIRFLSFDELPQLCNVLKGDMSLIGPRPLMPRYLALYNQEQSRRHNIRPGITGWAQVHGRNNISWTEKFKLDVWYVDHCSLWVDIKIMILTVKNVVVGKDTKYQGGNVNSEGFNGYN